MGFISAWLFIIFSFIMTFWFLFLGIWIFFIIVNWKLYEKAGKPGWTSIIPIYKNVVLLEIAGYKWYYVFLFLLNFIPVIGNALFIVFSISYQIKIAKSFGQGTMFGIGLFLLNPVFRAIISFDKEIKYVAPAVNGDIDFNDLF